MKRIDENQILDEKIRLLEIKRNHDFEILRNQFNETLDSLKPVNIVKETIADFKKSKEIKRANIIFINFINLYINRTKIYSLKIQF